MKSTVLQSKQRHKHRICVLAWFFPGWGLVPQCDFPDAVLRRAHPANGDFHHVLGHRWDGCHMDCVIAMKIKLQDDLYS